MSHLPTLSICVPSRNRQPWFQETIRTLTASLRSDIELVFVDNSDDPSIMNGFIAPYLSDPRVKYLPSGDQTRPMVDNWEVAFEATTGRWIVFIGDDDHVDPDVADLILSIEAKMPDVEALDWARLHFTWPYPGKAPHSNPIPLLSEIHEVPKKQLKERAFRWDHAREVLGCGFGIYHGAVARPLMERIRAASKTNRWFEHPIVDYDNIFKVIMHGKRFVHIRRPLSVMGVCPASNTAATTNLEDAKKKQATFHREHKTSMDEMAIKAGFPFLSHQGVTACIAMTHHWFAQEYGYDFSGFEENLPAPAPSSAAAIRPKTSITRSRRPIARPSGPGRAVATSSISSPNSRPPSARAPSAACSKALCSTTTNMPMWRRLRTSTGWPRA